MRYKIISFILIMVILLTLFCGCTGDEGDGNDYERGYKRGYDEGKHHGEHNLPYKNYQNRQESAEYQNGYRTGYDDGYYGRDSEY